MKKRILSSILCFAMILTISSTALANETEPPIDIYDNSEAIILSAIEASYYDKYDIDISGVPLGLWDDIFFDNLLRCQFTKTTPSKLQIFSNYKQQ